MKLRELTYVFKWHKLKLVFSDLAFELIVKEMSGSRFVGDLELSIQFCKKNWNLRKLDFILCLLIQLRFRELRFTWYILF